MVRSHSFDDLRVNGVGTARRTGTGGGGRSTPGPGSGGERGAGGGEGGGGLGGSWVSRLWTCPSPPLQTTGLNSTISVNDSGEHLQQQQQLQQQKLQQQHSRFTINNDTLTRKHQLFVGYTNGNAAPAASSDSRGDIVSPVVNYNNSPPSVTSSNSGSSADSSAASVTGNFRSASEINSKTGEHYNKNTTYPTNNSDNTAYLTNNSNNNTTNTTYPTNNMSSSNAYPTSNANKRNNSNSDDSPASAASRWPVGKSQVEGQVLTSTLSDDPSAQQPIRADDNDVIASVHYNLIKEAATDAKRLVTTIELNLDGRGTSLTPSDIVVRSSKNGKKLNIVSNKPLNGASITSSGGLQAVTSAGSELNRRLTLPVTVDPYGVTARLDATGRCLVIEAPVVD